MERSEKLLPVADAVRDAVGIGVPQSTAYRWASTGIRGIRLRSWEIGGRLVTNRLSVVRFLKKVAEAPSDCFGFPVGIESWFYAHPAAKEFSREMGEVDYIRLKESIAAQGQFLPILLCGGKVLDGRARLRACLDLGVKPATIELDEGEACKVSGVVEALNGRRRRVSQSELSMSIAIKRCGPSHPKADAGISGDARALENQVDSGKCPPCIAKSVSRLPEGSRILPVSNVSTRGDRLLPGDGLDREAGMLVWGGWAYSGLTPAMTAALGVLVDAYREDRRTTPDEFERAGVRLTYGLAKVFDRGRHFNRSRHPVHSLVTGRAGRYRLIDPRDVPLGASKDESINSSGDGNQRGARGERKHVDGFVAGGSPELDDRNMGNPMRCPPGFVDSSESASAAGLNWQPLFDTRLRVSRGESMNILDKADKSSSPTPHGVPVVKRQKHQWSKLGRVGSFSWVDKESLNIDGRYQREQVSQAKVLEIARNWDWLMVGTISVIERDDGTFWVFDGGHRTRASFYRDDVQLLPCMVHEIASVSEEAKVFVARNTMVSSVSAFDRYRAALCASDPVAIQTQAMLDELGLTLAHGGKSTKDFITCIGTIQSAVEANATDAKKVLEFCMKLSGDKPVSGKLLQAMFLLHQHLKPRFDVIDVYGEKISRHSQREIEIKMKQFSVECGNSGVTVFAKAILELVNHRNRSNRIQW